VEAVEGVFKEAPKRFDKDLKKKARSRAPITADSKAFRVV